MEQTNNCIIFGRQFSSPVMKGMMACSLDVVANEAARTNTILWAGAVSDDELASATRTGAAVIRVIKCNQDTEKLIKAVKHDEVFGAFAYAMNAGFDFDMGTPEDKANKIKESTEIEAIQEEMWEIASKSTLPWIALGIRSVREAGECIRAGAEGVFISHHVSAKKVLPQIKAVFGDDVAIFVRCDGTTDITVDEAIEMGACAICVSRPNK